MIWAFAGFGVQQGLRLASNLTLTRLLHLPKIFGLMSVVQIIIAGVEMLSDIGIGPAIIQSNRGGDPRMLNTAWTVQIIRGFLLGAIVMLLAYPVSWFYREPQLLPLLLTAGLSPMIRGFNSTRVATLNRQLNLGYLTRLEMITQVVAVAVTIASAWQLRSAWALLIGWLAGDVVRITLSHLILPGQSNRIEWDREAARELVRVARWVIVGTAATYGVQRLDQLSLGRMLSLSELGIYNIAIFISGAVMLMGQTMGSKVLFPMLSETLREAPDRLAPRLRKVRLLWALPTAAVLILLALGGRIVIGIMYPPQYQGAGWMLQIIAAGSIAAVVNQSYTAVWLAMGEFRTNTLLMFVQLPVLFGAMYAGQALHGIVGFVTGVALVELLVSPVQAFLISRRKLWQPSLDLPLLACAASLVALGCWQALKFPPAPVH